MIPLPISLCVFDTTKQHFGRKDVYRRAITALDVKAPLKATFQNLLVHIKKGPEADVYAEQIAFYTALGFEILTTEGDFSHNQPNHQSEYSRDLVTVYGHQSIQRTPYVLHWESDWAPDVRGDDDFRESIASGMFYLSQRPHVMSVRFPRFLNEVERLRGLRAKHGLDVRVEEETEIPFAGHFAAHNDSISLNPNIMRTRDIFWATRLLKADFSRMSTHVEMMFTRALAAPALIDGKMPYAIFNPQEVGVLHWGTKEGEEDVAGGAYDR